MLKINLDVNHVISKKLRKVVLKITGFTKNIKRSEVQISDCMYPYVDPFFLIF